MSTTRNLLLSLLLVLPACTVLDRAVDVAQVSAAAADRYADLAGQVVHDQVLDPADGPGITEEEWAATPESVRTLARRLLKALHAQRFAWHSVLFQLNEGPDPDGLGIEPVELPEVAAVTSSTGR